MSETNKVIRISFNIQFGDYIVSLFDDNSIWLENKNGEGMQVWSNEITNLLDKYFIENF